MTPEALFDALRELGPAAWFDAPGMLGVETGAVLLMLAEDPATHDATPPRPLEPSRVLRGRVGIGGSIRLADTEQNDIEQADVDSRNVAGSAAQGDSSEGRLAARLLGLRPGWYAYESAPRVHAGRVCVRSPAGPGTSADGTDSDDLLPQVWHARVRAAFVWPGADSAGTGKLLVAIDARDAAAARDVTSALREAHARASVARTTHPSTVASRTVTDDLLTSDAGRTRERYCDGVRTIQTLLRAGECYQVNLARHVDVASPRDPLAVWRHLRAHNRARRAMYLHTAHGAVVSNSPELLLHARGAELRSAPIKGTSVRTPAAVAFLRHSEKERAELRMIVDLVRADLGRVAVPGSVRVGPRRVGPVGHVEHAMQAVRATLAPGMDGHDAFRALFPAGSVTGAPRLRAMQVIRDLEEVPRGVYCGSLGAWLPPEAGDTRIGAWWNVAIRTVTFARGFARVHVGAGIVLDSDPEREFHETTLKARRMLEALA